MINVTLLKFYEKPVFINSLLLGVNIVLFIFKIVFSLISKSLALQADAFDNLTDIVMTAAALVGIFYSNKKPNEKFPYGYYKIENIISLIISFFIFFTAYTIIVESITDIVNSIDGIPKIIIISPVIIIFLISSLGISFFLSSFLKLVGKKSGSPVIKSEADEKLYDNFISLSVIIGFICAFFNLALADSIIGLIICIFLIKGGYNIFVNSTKTLLDAVIEFDKRKELLDLIDFYPKVKNVDNLEIRSYGRYIFVEVNLSLNKDLPLVKIQSLKNNLSLKIKEQFPEIFKLIIITQTQEKPLIKIAVPLLENKDLDSQISDHFGEAKCFAIFEIKKGKDENTLQNYNISSNKFAHLEKRKGINIADWLISEKIDKIYLKKELKKGPKLIFENSLVQIIVTELNSLNEIIDEEIKIKILE
ncbi:MAG: cation diffusion facilitator family transporter [Promethearchaeota archaeon]